MVSKRLYYSSEDLPSNGSRVYVIGKSPEGPIKVGIAINPRKRVMELECANGIRFPAIWISPVCLNAGRVEILLHARMDRYRLVGEWFTIPFYIAVGMAAQCKYERVSRYARVRALAEIAARLKPIQG